MARTQEERKVETRGRLVKAASDLFAQHGIDAVSVDAVADAAERTSGAVYAHFGSKQGLLLAILDEWKQALVSVIGAEFEVANTAQDRLRAVWTNFGASSDGRSAQRLLLDHELWLRASRDPEVATMLCARYIESREWLTRGFAQWVADGLIDPVVPLGALAGLFKAMITGMAMQRQVDPEAFGDDEAVAALAVLIGVREDSETGHLPSEVPDQAASVEQSTEHLRHYDAPGAFEMASTKADMPIG